MYLFFRKILRFLLGKRPHIVGIYHSYSDVPIPKDEIGYGKHWKKQQKNALDLVGEQSFLPELSQSFLSVTALQLNQLSKDSPISVLDFGGGTGFLYFEMNRKGSLLYPNNIRWTVVDEKNSLALGRQFIKDEDNIDFFLETPESQKFDVIHISSVLQYIDDVYGLLSNLIEKTEAEHIILSRITGGADTPDYYTKRTTPDGSIPIHVLNLKKLSKFLESYDFQPVFRSSWAKEHIREHHYYKVPVDHQFYCTSHMFFSKKLMRIPQYEFQTTP